jgi:predicted RNase H-like HicB family nuclease
VSALKGGLAQGETHAECLAELAKVQELWLKSARRNKEEIPTAAEVTAKLRKMVA